EVAVQATAVGAELLEEIGAEPFAHGVVVRAFSENDIIPLPVKGDFSGACGCNPDANFNVCSFISDFHGTTATRVRNDIEYNVDIEVNYVLENDPAVISGSPTFALRVDLQITSPLLYVGHPDNPLVYRMTRIFTRPNVLI